MESILQVEESLTALVSISKENDCLSVGLDCQLIGSLGAVSLRADLHGAILAYATRLRQAYDMTYDCRSVLKHVLKCYDIFSDVHNNRKSRSGPVVSRCRMRQNFTV